MNDRDGFLWLWSRLRRQRVFVALNVGPWVLISFLISIILLLHSEDTTEPSRTGALLLGAPTLAGFIAARESRRVYRRTEARFEAMLRQGASVPTHKPDPFPASAYARIKVDFRWWAAALLSSFIIPAGLFMILFR